MNQHNMVKYALIWIIFFGSLVYGAGSGTATASKKNTVELLNIAAKQRMLSQRIAKDYLYVNRKVAVDKAAKQFKKSLLAFKAGQKYLSESIDNPEIENLITFVDMSKKELEDISQRQFNLDNAQLVMDLSESILEGSQYIVDSLREGSADKDTSLVVISGKQRMLAQRIAKYYIAYQAGIQDKNTVDQMKDAVKQFDSNNKKLLNNVSNTSVISQELKRVNQLWKIVYKFYLNIEKGGLPFIVFTSADNITSRMDKITELYAELN